MAVDPLGIGLAVLATVGLAGQSIAVRQAAKSRSITDLVAVVFAVNVLVLVPATVALYYPTFGLTPTAVGAFAVAGVLGSLLARAALFVGIHRLGASRAEPLKSTFPLVAVGSAVLVLGEPLTATLAVGVGLLVAGAAAVSGDARASGVTASGRQVWVDVAFPLLAALLLGVDPVFTKVGFAEGTPPLVGVTVRVLAAAGGFGGYLLWRRLRGRGYRPSRPTRLTVATGVANTVYLVAYLAALARAPVSVVAPVLGASPLLVLLGSVVAARRDEQVTLRLGAAVAVLVAGVVLVLQG
ncbi:DMT family transporter [Haloarcula sp. S1CR25-12]|uniref:DMT family transporter n=1 Tax=Haloarcula saliterrae TaxID=2950534 RepID=A0ABU2FDM3_9EURY|nr:DMT family transporter [Haloarcula sp. S1CR25-12]MDS0260368.1 DMT family transporter [Haloarcula sp. S1CR25-12]